MVLKISLFPVYLSLSSSIFFSEIQHVVNINNIFSLHETEIQVKYNLTFKPHVCLVVYLIVESKENWTVRSRNDGDMGLSPCCVLSRMTAWASLYFMSLSYPPGRTSCVSQLEFGISNLGPISLGWRAVSHSTNTVPRTCLWVCWRERVATLRKQKNCGLCSPSQISSLLYCIFHTM